MSSSSEIGDLRVTEYDVVFSNGSSFPIFKGKDGEYIFSNSVSPFTPVLLGELAGVRRVKVQR